MRPIDAGEVLKIVERYGTTSGTSLGRHSGIADIIYYQIEKLPTIEAEPVRRGRWISYGRDTAYNRFYRCSVCDKEIVWYDECDEQLYGYCPNCGAKMEAKS